MRGGRGVRGRRRGRRRRDLGAGGGGGGLGLGYVLGIALFEHAGGDAGHELLLVLIFAGAGHVIELAARLGDGLCEAGNLFHACNGQHAQPSGRGGGEQRGAYSALRLAGKVLGGSEAGNGEGDESDLHGYRGQSVVRFGLGGGERLVADEGNRGRGNGEMQQQKGREVGTS